MSVGRRDFLSQDLVVPNHDQTPLGPFQNDWTKGHGIEVTDDGGFEVTQPGVYLVTGVVRWEQWQRPANGAVRHNYRHVFFKVNGEVNCEFTLPSTGDETDMRMPYSAVLELAKSDRLEPFVWQVTGDDLKVIGGESWKTWLSIVRLA